MADINNFNDELNRLIKQFDTISSSFERTADKQYYFSREVENYSDDVLKALKLLLINAENDFKDVIDSEINKREKILNDTLKEEKDIRDSYIENLDKNNDDSLKEEKNVRDSYIEELEKENNDNLKKYQNLERDKQALLAAASVENNKYVKDSLRQKAIEIQQQQDNLDKQGRVLSLRLQGEKELADFEESRIKAADIRNKLYQDVEKKLVDGLEDITSRSVKELRNTFEHAADAITDSYNKYASSMSASLDLTVRDISNLQKNIAKNLNDESLGRAISNLQVMVEAAALTSAGYTNEAKLQQSATDIEIGQRIAPNVDFNSATVRNLVNALGPDFTHRFSAIQAAVQETAGSTASISAGFSNFITDMEPVFLSAQYSLDAVQGAGDVEATLSSAIENSIITQSDAQKYRSMILELMDPSRALNSKNMAVRVAATSGNFDYLSGNPMDALNALLQGRETYYSNFDLTGTSAESKIGRSLGAAIAGDDTFSATYNPQSLTGVTAVYTTNLENVYENRLEELESGNYTTRKEEIDNIVQNSPATQALSTISQNYPKIASVLLPTIAQKIDALPKRIADHLNRKIDNSYTTDIDTTDINIDDSTVINNTNKSSTLLQKLSKANTATPGMNSGGKWSTRFQKASQAVGGRTGGLAIASYGAGVMGAMNIASNISKEGSAWGAFGNDFSSGTESTMNLAGIGSAIGTLIAPGIGTAIGAGVGGLVGIVGSVGRSIHESNELTKERNRLQEEENRMLNEAGVEKLSNFQAESIVARGGGTISTSKGMFEIATHATGLSKVPYDDYLALLHKDEAVVTANAANEYRKSNPNFWNSPYNKNYQQNNNNDEVVYNLKEQTKSIVDAIKGNDEKDMQSLTVNTPKQYIIKNASLA